MEFKGEVHVYINPSTLCCIAYYIKHNFLCEFFFFFSFIRFRSTRRRNEEEEEKVIIIRKKIYNNSISYYLVGTVHYYLFVYALLAECIVYNIF